MRQMMQHVEHVDRGERSIRKGHRLGRRDDINPAHSQNLGSNHPRRQVFQKAAARAEFHLRTRRHAPRSAQQFTIKPLVDAPQKRLAFNDLKAHLRKPRIVEIEACGLRKPQPAEQGTGDTRWLGRGHFRACHPYTATNKCSGIIGSASISGIEDAEYRIHQRRFPAKTHSARIRACVTMLRFFAARGPGGEWKADMTEHDEFVQRAADAPRARPLGDRRATAWTTAIFVTVCGGFLLWWLSMALRYPYFYLADMDLLAPLEALNINSGLKPWVTQHPGYGMYVFDALTLRAAAFFDLVSAAELRSVEASLSALLPMAELTSVIRLYSPVLVFIIALSLWGVAASVGRFSPLMSVLVFAAIASSEGLAYHAAMVRVDLYSVFFWSLALPLAAAAGLARGSQWRIALCVATGFFLGVAFLTKIQSGVHLAAAALLFWVVQALPDPSGIAQEGPKKIAAQRFGLILAAINFCVLSALVVTAKYTDGQRFTLFGVVDDPGNYAGVHSARAVSVVVAALALMVFQIPKLSTWRPMALVSILARTATPVVAGGVLAVLSPLVLYRSPATGIHFALHNLQNLFWTDLFLFRRSEPTDTILAAVSGYRWWVIAGLVAAASLVTIAVLVARSPRPWSALAMAAAWPGFAAAVTLAVVRTAPRDVLWFDTACALSTFMLVAIALRVATRGRRAITAAAAAIALFVCAGNAARLAEFPSRMDTNYHIYGWTESPWFDSWLGSPRYNDMMKARYPEPTRALAARQARGHYRLRVMTAHIFQNAHVTLANVGPLAVGQPLWRNHREWVVSEFPRGYAFAHVVDPLEVPLKRRAFLSHVMKHEEWLDRIVPPPAEAGGQAPGGLVRALSILPRRDIEIVLFVTADDLPRVGAAGASLNVPVALDDAVQIAVTSAGVERRLYGVVLPYYTVLPVADFSGPYVFLVRERSLPAAFGIFRPRASQAPAQDSPAPTSESAPPQDAVHDNATSPSAP